jgi:hypothetical protein
MIEVIIKENDDPNDRSNNNKEKIMIMKRVKKMLQRVIKTIDAFYTFLSFHIRFLK